MKALVTGGDGFIGHHLVEYILQNTDWSVVSLDKPKVSETPDRFQEIITPEYSGRFSQVFHDLKQEVSVPVAQKIGEVNYVFHLAASVSVEGSIKDPLSAVLDNVVGTCHLLNFARTTRDLKKFIYFSTDEVFGSVPEGVFSKEDDPYKPSSPYSAAKAGGGNYAKRSKKLSVFR